MITPLLLATVACAAPPEVCFSPGHCDHQVVDVVEHAQRTLDVFAYAINRRGIVVALVSAKRRGVAVRVLVDRSQSHGWKQRLALAELRRAGIPVRHQVGTRIMHVKAVIADRQVVAFGSMNLTDPGVESNDEVVTVWGCPGLAERFAEEFEARWGRAPPSAALPARRGLPRDLCRLVHYERRGHRGRVP